MLKNHQGSSWRSDNKQGFMLIQTLVGAGLMALLGLAIAGMLKDMWAESHSMQTKNNELVLVQALRQQVSTPKLCMESLLNKEGFPSTGSRDLEIVLNPGEPTPMIVKNGASLPTWSLGVQTFQMTNIRVAIASIGGESTYVGDMEFQGTATNGKKQSFRLKNVGKFFVRVNDANRSIVYCYATDSANSLAEHTCKSLKGVFNPATQACDLTQLKRDALAEAGTCPAGHTLSGFSTGGAIICTRAKTTAEMLSQVGQCPAGQKLSGFNGAGAAICGPIEVTQCGGTSESSGYSRDRNSPPPSCCPAGKRSSCNPILSSVVNGDKNQGFSYSWTQSCICS